MGNLNTLVVTAGGAVIAALVPSTASAQVRYGSWHTTGDCRTARAPSGAFRGNSELPQTGGSLARECKWERDVEECPRIRDNLRHPIQCMTRKQKSGYSLFAPRE